MPGLASVFAANSLPPDFSTPPKRHSPGPDSLGWGLIGTGAGAATFITDAIRDQPPLPSPGRGAWQSNCWIVGVFSHDEFRAHRFAESHFIPHAFINLADLLARADIACVYVGGLPRHRTQATLAALAAGKHVLTESPLALTEEDALTLAHTAARRGLVLGVNFHRRADPAVQAMRQAVQEGEIGDILGGRISNAQLLPPHMQTWRLQPNGGGVVVDRTLHDLDLLRYLLRDEIVEVSARAPRSTLAGEVEDEVFAHVEMRRSGLFQLHDSFLIPHTTTALELYGSTGTLVARHCFVDDRPSELILLRRGVEQQIPLARENPYAALIRDFVAAVRDESLPPLATAADGLRALLGGAAVLESLRARHPVALPSTERIVDDYSVE